MLHTLAVSNYRSLRNFIAPLGALTLITGPNGSGKSNVYRSLRLLAETARGGLIAPLAKEGGFASTLWAGRESFSGRTEAQDERASRNRRLVSHDDFEGSRERQLQTDFFLQSGHGSTSGIAASAQP
jgi:predicted ATPase